MLRRLALWTLCLASPAFAEVYLQAKSGFMLQADTSPSAWSSRPFTANYTGSEAQRFAIIPTGGGLFRICRASGPCLTVEGDDARVGAPIAFAPFTGAEGQHWSFEATAEPGYSRIRSKLGTYLDSLFAAELRGIYMWTWSSAETSSQLWRQLEPITVTPSSVPAHCPHGPLKNPGAPGDGYANFDFGAGPWVELSVALSLTDPSTLSARTSFDAYRNDLSPFDVPAHVRGTWNDVVYRAPAGRRIALMPSEFESRVEFLAPGAGLEVLLCADGEVLYRTPGYGPVLEIRLIADTGAEDASTDEDCGCDAQFRGADFRPLNLALE